MPLNGPPFRAVPHIRETSSVEEPVDDGNGNQDDDGIGDTVDQEDMETMTRAFCRGKPVDQYQNA